MSGKSRAIDVLNDEVEVVGDLEKVGRVAEKLEAELEALLAHLSQAEERRLVLVNEADTIESRQADLEAQYAECATALANGSGVVDASNPLQLQVIGRTLLMVECLQEAEACNDVEASPGDLVQLTSMVGRALSLKAQAKGLEVPLVANAVQGVLDRTIQAVHASLVHELQKIGWLSDTFSKPLDSQPVVTCYEWLVALQPRHPERALTPFVEPFRKRFVFHFLTTEATSRPEHFRECIKWTLNVLTARSEFLEAKIGHEAVVAFLRLMSELITTRSKRDIVATLSTSPQRKDEVFLEVVDELFSWSALLEQHYNYAMSDGTLPHALMSAVFASEASPVTQHWLALEAAALRDEPLSNVLEALQSRTRHRLVVLPEAWQRRAYFDDVHVKALHRVVDSEYALEPLHQLGMVLDDWSLRPEFDQDHGVLSALSRSCFERLDEGLIHLEQRISNAFLSSLAPWFSKNWLYVTEATAEALQAGASRTDLSPELCEPFETLREDLRSAQHSLGKTLFTRFALKLASELDLEMTRLLVEEYDDIDVSAELARQFAFDANLVFGLWAPVVEGTGASAALLFKRFHECVRILQFDANEITAVSAVEKLAETDQKLLLSERFQVHNLTGSQVARVAYLRKDALE